MRSDPRANPNEAFYSGVVSRVFPLRADPSTLQDFVDRYLNREEISEQHYFRPANSYVFLQVLTYQRMSETLTRLGYISQNEVLFSIPLHWYRRDDRGLSTWHGKRYRLVRGQDTFVSPFLFVDNDLSLLGGRELYGWPKYEMFLNNDANTWLVHPEHPERVLAVDVSMFEELFDEKDRQRLRLINIDRDANFALGAHQYQKTGPANWLDRANRGLVGAAGVKEHSDLHWSLWREQFDEQLEGVDPRIAARCLQDALTDQQLWAASVSPNLNGRITNNIGIKQFRHADDPDITAYQSMGNTRARTRHVRGAGQLGRFEHASADLTGGYGITFFEYGQLPIVSTLGLIPSGHAGNAFHLDPVSPGWIDADIDYDGAVETFVVEIHGKREPIPQIEELPDFSTEYDAFTDTEICGHNEGSW